MLDRDAEETDHEADEAAILDAIRSDWDSFMARDKARWETHWVHDDRFTSIVECGPLMVSRRYRAFRDKFFNAMDMSAKPAAPEVQREHLAIHVDGNTAWAHFDQIFVDTGDPMLPPSFTHNVRVFEQRPNGWKVVFHGVWSLPGRQILTPAIEVEINADVVWMNAAAEERLRSFPALTVSAGKLRTARPALQKDLVDALARASELLAYVRYREAERDPASGVSFPLLLGEDEDHHLLVCKVQVHGGRIYVCFGDDERTDQSIQSAAIVFGLSEAQHRMATLVARGMSLQDAASAMGITVNTARTHLRRMYDKTGARNRAALLRIFLAIG